MKKIITILLIAILSFSSAFAYTSTELESKKNLYKKVIGDKVGKKLENLSEEKLRKVLILIDKLVENYDNNKNLSDSKKLKKIAILSAFKEIISEKIEDDFSDIDNILDTVNKKLEIIMITDKRCGDECKLAPIIIQLKQIPDLKSIEIKELDYDEKEAKDLMVKNGITKLPAAIFTDNSISELKDFLKITSDNKYSLELGGKFNPTIERSAKGFMIIDKRIIEEIKKDSYIKGNKNSEILYLEYSDMECPYCAKLHNSGTLGELEKKYGTEISYSLQHFPLDFHKNALPASEALECLAKQEGSNSYFDLEHIIFSNKNSDLDFIVEEAVKLGADKTELKNCIENKNFENKINSQQNRGTNLFGITGTPGNVLINIKTGEYEVISGAYPTSSFISIIEKLLK